jgi:transcriptional regulator with XRE-family HTH domain
MSKPRERPQSRYSAAAIERLGQLVRRARIERKITTTELAERAGISRGLLQRIEKGDPGCTIGAVFEVAAILNIALFDSGQAAMSQAITDNKAILSLLPKVVRAHRTETDDDF